MEQGPGEPPQACRECRTARIWYWCGHVRTLLLPARMMADPGPAESRLRRLAAAEQGQRALPHLLLGHSVLCVGVDRAG